jgi:hypothetical protein
MARHSIWTRAKHSDGLERPRFWEPLAAQKYRGVAPAPQTGKGSVCEVFCPCPSKRKKRKGELEEPVAPVVEKYATFIDSAPDHAVNSALKMLLRKDKHLMSWKSSNKRPRGKMPPRQRKKQQREHVARILKSKNLVAFVRAAATGMTLYLPPSCGNGRARAESIP